jgi:Mg-chelatase subunit ChlD
LCASLALAGFGLAVPHAAGQAPEKAQEAPAAKPTERPDVEVVFCIDTTGSMSGLIDAAKAKVWSICNQIAAGRPTPRLKVGLIGYRDRGDEYVTKVFDLTEDLDAIHEKLMAFKAQGGGDTPESVNQALHEAVTKVNWTKGQKALKIIFLVGDAPPKDYAGDVKYQETCQKAVKDDIIINTVQCGHAADTRKHWVEIARLSEGSFVQIDQQGGPVVVVATPFDEKLGKINAELANSTLGFGDARQQAWAAQANATNAALPSSRAADRIGFYGQSGRFVSYDLLENVKNGKVKLEQLKKEELPAELRKLTLDEQKAFLKKLDERRQELSKQVVELDKQRREFIAKKEAEDRQNRAADSFDGRVLRVLQGQAARHNIQYGTAGKRK